MANRLITVRFRADPRTKRLLDRLRHEKDINPSAWLRRVVDRALADELPDVADVEGAEPPESDLQTPVATEDAPKPDPQKTPIATENAPGHHLAVQEPGPRTPIEGWRPRRRGDTWVAFIESPSVAELPDNDELPGTPIVLTDQRGESWTTTITKVVERTATTIVVENSGRPRS